MVEVTRDQARAELDALNEEREARRLASAPRFTVHAGGGGKSGNQISQNLNFHNVGAVASDVRIIVRDDSTVYLDQFQSAWGGGERESYQFHYVLPDRPERLEVNIIFKDRFGEELTQTIQLIADPENGHRYLSEKNGRRSA